MHPSEEVAVSRKLAKMAVTHICLVISPLLLFAVWIEADLQADNLRSLLASKWSQSKPVLKNWLDVDHTLDDYVVQQSGSMQDDKIVSLPGQPGDMDFDQYAGYVTVDANVGKVLFYYFVESPQSSSQTNTNPLVLWLGGGNDIVLHCFGFIAGLGISSLAFGAMQELGPFRVNSDGETLFKNTYSWNKVANVLFLESPAGVGFSYSNSTSVYNTTGDISTANDAYAFLINWLERFPQYKGRDFYIAGEGYAGHYVSQLAYTASLNNAKNNTNQTIVNLKGVLIGNGLLNAATNFWGSLENFWSHNLISDETFYRLKANCNFSNLNVTQDQECIRFYDEVRTEIGEIDMSNIYAPLCLDRALKKGKAGSVDVADPCSYYYTDAYLNLPEVQAAFHVNVQLRSPYSGDLDGILPTLGTRYCINALKLPVETTWRPWYTGSQLGGYVEAYKGLTFATVRGAGQHVPIDQPERALTLISSFLKGEVPPKS